MSKKNIIVMLLAFLSLVAAVGFVWMVVALYTTTTKISNIQDHNTAVSRETRGAAEAAKKSSEDSEEILRIIQDCLNPEGKCAQESNANTAAIIEAFNKSVTRAAIYAAACADQVNPQSPKEIEACVFRLLAGDEG